MRSKFAPSSLWPYAANFLHAQDRTQPARHERPRSLRSRWLPTAEYCFFDHWLVDGHIEDVAQLLLNTANMSEWWPQISRIIVAQAGGPDGMSRSFAARTFGFMPYELAVRFDVVEVKFPHRFAVEIAGDLQGHGSGNLRQDGSQVVVDFESTIRVARPALRLLSLIARPAMYANHCWLMRQGECGLQ